MAVTVQNSTEYANTLAFPQVRNGTTDWRGRLRILRFNFTQTNGNGDVGSSANLVKLPAGRVRVFLHMSRVVNSTFGVGRTLDLGWAAYYSGVDGSAVIADPDGLDAAQSVASAGSYNPTGTVGGDETYLFDSASGVLITATVGGDTIPNSATISGYIVYVHD